MTEDQEALLKLITEGSHAELVVWAEKNEVDKNILRLLKKGYQVTHKGASEYRGALVFTFKAIVEKCLAGSTGVHETT
jgi:hypothetical protein